MKSLVFDLAGAAGGCVLSLSVALLYAGGGLASDWTSIIECVGWLLLSLDISYV